MKKSKYQPSYEGEYFGMLSPYITHVVNYPITCCGLTSHIEIGIEPLINDLAVVTVKCPKCGKEHRLYTDNSAGRVLGPMKFVGVEYRD